LPGKPYSPRQIKDSMINIRPFVAADKPPIMNILQNTPEFKPIEVTVAGELIDSYLDNGKKSGYTLLVAEEDGIIYGYVCFGDTPLTEGTWDVYWIAVMHESQGKGIGRGLMAATELSIASQQGRLILIETSSIPEYEKTRRFYHGIGYSIVCRVPDFYTIGDDKIIFEKRL
jgi:GNAT superfamily N-acetyltransferase